MAAIVSSNQKWSDETNVWEFSNISGHKLVEINLHQYHQQSPWRQNAEQTVPIQLHWNGNVVVILKKY